MMLLAVVLAVGTWVVRAHQSTKVVERSSDAVVEVDQLQLAKDADAAEQRAILRNAASPIRHPTSLKWNPPLETSSVVRDITESAKP
jgi:hypothetical protein